MTTAGVWLAILAKLRLRAALLMQGASFAVIAREL